MKFWESEVAATLPGRHIANYWLAVIPSRHLANSWMAVPTTVTTLNMNVPSTLNLGFQLKIIY